MIEVTIRKYLEDNLDGVPVYMEYPKKPGKKFVVLQLADGGQINHIDAATFFVTVYADTLYAAAEIKEQVKSILYYAVILPCISSVSLGQEQSGSDSANNMYQYSLTFNFYYFREET